MNNYKNPFIENNQQVIDVDLWEPNPEDMIFKTCKDAIIAPVCEFYGVNIEGFL